MLPVGSVTAIVAWNYRCLAASGHPGPGQGAVSDVAAYTEFRIEFAPFGQVVQAAFVHAAALVAGMVVAARSPDAGSWTVMPSANYCGFAIGSPV